MYTPDVLGVELLAFAACWVVPLVRSAGSYECTEEGGERLRRRWCVYWATLCGMLFVSRWAPATIVPPLVRACVCLWMFGGGGSEQLLLFLEHIDIDIDLDSDFILGNNPAVVDVIRSYKGAGPLSPSLQGWFFGLREVLRQRLIKMLGGMTELPPIPDPPPPPTPMPVTKLLEPYKQSISELEEALEGCEAKIDELRADVAAAQRNATELSIELAHERSKRTTLESGRVVLDGELGRLLEIEVQANEWKEEARYLQKLLDAKSLKAISLQKEAQKELPAKPVGLPKTMNVAGDQTVAGVYTLLEGNVPSWIMGRHILQRTPTAWLLTTTSVDHLSPRRGKVRVLVGDEWVPCVVNAAQCRSPSMGTLARH